MVITHSPSATAVTTPFSSTVATFSSLDSYASLTSVASSGVILAPRALLFSPFVTSSMESGASTPVGVITTFTWVVEEILASATDTVTSASPAPTAVTRPVSSTVATVSSEEVQVRFSLDAASAIFSCSALSSVPYSILSCWVSPFSSTMSVGSPTEVISTPQPTRLTAIATAIIRHAIRVNTLTDIVFIEFLLFI